MLIFFNRATPKQETKLTILSLVKNTTRLFSGLQWHQNTRTLNKMPVLQSFYGLAAANFGAKPVFISYRTAFHITAIWSVARS